MITKLGYTLRVYRIEHDLKLKDMAEAVGISHITPSAIEHGRIRMSERLLDKLIKVYKLPSELASKLRALRVESQSYIRIPTYEDPQLQIT